jgi:putative phosphoesterase
VKLAIVTDVHADVHALQDALAAIERLGCDEIVCAGDIVDWGRFPEKTIALLRDRRVPTIRGNHDRWCLEEGRCMNGLELTVAATTFLGSLPTSWTRTIEGVRVAVHHGRPGNDMAGVYPNDLDDELASMLLDRANCDVLILGHVHESFAHHVGQRLVCNPGALLRDPAQPMGGAMLFDRESGTFAPAPAPGGGTFGILELPELRFTVHFARDGAEVKPGARH